VTATASTDDTNDVSERGRIGVIFAAATVLFWTFVIGYAYTRFLPRGKFAVAFLGAMIGLYALHEFIDQDISSNPISAVLLAGAALSSVITAGYVAFNYSILVNIRAGYALPHEYVIAGLFVMSMLYLTYREFGISFLAVVLAAIGYGYLGPQFPGLLGHGGFSTRRLLRLLVLDVRGFFGSLNEIVAVWISLFILYAGLLRAYGAFDLIIRGAFYAAGFVRSGVAQSAVLASTIIGSVNGSAAANAAMTGSFTIPLMKRSGLRGETAGGIEAVASSGGQILPPVMGAAAFVMASILGIQYVSVIAAGLLPAVIFLVSVAVAVHYACIDQIDSTELDVADHVDMDRTRNDLLLDALRFILPLALLVYLLGVLQWTITSAALATCVGMLVTGITFPVGWNAYTRDESVQELTVRLASETIEGGRYAVEILAPIAIIVASINAVVDILLSTGVPNLLSLALLDLSGGVMLVAFLIAMGICILLGLGMPTVAAYTLVALLVAPSLIEQFGVPDLAAHYFVFYSAIISGLTPPIAVSVVVAAGVAQSNFWGTCVEAMKIAAPLYVLPLTFIYNPEIVVGGLSVQTALSTLATLGGAVAVVHGLNFPTMPTNSRFVQLGARLVLVSLGAVVMVYPGEPIRFALLALGLGFISFQIFGPTQEVTESPRGT